MGKVSEIDITITSSLKGTRSKRERASAFDFGPAARPSWTAPERVRKQTSFPVEGRGSEVEERDIDQSRTNFGKVVKYEHGRMFLIADLERLQEGDREREAGWLPKREWSD